MMTNTLSGKNMENLPIQEQPKAANSVPNPTVPQTPINQNQPTPPVPTNVGGEKDQKTFTTVIVALVLLLFFGLGLFFLVKDKNKGTTNNQTQQTTNQTSINGNSTTLNTSSQNTNTTTTAPDSYAGWKTYTSKDNTFTLRYPNYWNYTDDVKSVTFTSTQTGYSLQIVRLDLLPQNDPYSKCRANCVDCAEAVAIDIQQIKISNILTYDALKFYDTIPVSGNEIVVYRYCIIPQVNKDLRIELSADKNLENSRDVIDKVLASITFPK
jgi:hypothetical protein